MANAAVRVHHGIRVCRWLDIELMGPLGIRARVRERPLEPVHVGVESLQLAVLLRGASPAFLLGRLQDGLGDSDVANDFAAELALGPAGELVVGGERDIELELAIECLVCRQHGLSPPRRWAASDRPLALRRPGAP